MDIEQLKEYIDSSVSNMQQLAGADEEEQQLLLYETYANFLDMITDSKQILKEMRTKFKIREGEVKKWMQENEEEEEEEEDNQQPEQEVENKEEENKGEETIVAEQIVQPEEVKPKKIKAKAEDKKILFSKPRSK